jgi:hypothetical protein
MGTAHMIEGTNAYIGQKIEPRHSLAPKVSPPVGINDVLGRLDRLNALAGTVESLARELSFRLNGPFPESAEIAADQAESTQVFPRLMTRVDVLERRLMSVQECLERAHAVL